MKLQKRRPSSQSQVVLGLDHHCFTALRSIACVTATLFKEHIWVVVRRNARKLRDILESCEAEKPVDVFNFMNRFTLDTIGEIGFGKCIQRPEDYLKSIKNGFHKFMLIIMSKALIIITSRHQAPHREINCFQILTKGGPKFLGMPTLFNLISIRSIILHAIGLIFFIRDMVQVIQV